MFKKTKIKIGAAIASTIMVAGAIGTAAGMINNNQSSHKILKSSKTIENANNNQQANNFIINQTKNQSENSFQALNNTVLPMNIKNY